MERNKVLQDHEIQAGFEPTDTKTIRVKVKSGADVSSIFFCSDDLVLVPRSEALTACALLSAMNSGRNLRIEGEVDRLFAERLGSIQALYSEWYSQLRPVSVFAGVRPERKREPVSRIALFFSGGVDSFYTLLKHRDEITDLIFVHGFDISLSNRELAERVERQLRTVAETLGKRFAVIRTDLRGILSNCGDWGHVTHGAALAAVAHLLPDEIGKIYIASSHYYRYQRPWGSHPSLDPLWSSDVLKIVHDGCERRRPEKTAEIARNTVVQKYLRVCWMNIDEAYNCCRCEKCLRTMIELQAAGALKQCSAFPEPLKLSRVRRMEECYSQELKGHLECLGDSPENRQLRRALRFAMLRKKIHRFFCTFFPE